MKNAVTLFLILCSIPVFTQSNAKDYIDQYKNIALQQMINTDVPASITLAQGIIESAVGTNVLAKQANNHFGIQCTENWEGEALYKLKGDRTTCYKVYNSSAESYIEHTTSLANNPQFENLFYVESNNYKRWAKGLEALKYSTSPDYANQLIQIIELYELDEIDTNIDLYQEESNSEKAENFEILYKSDEDVLYINDIKAVISSGKETPLEFAARMKIPLRKVLKYNDILLSQDFYPGQYVFLDRKKSKYTKELEIHKVKETDNIYLISQQYGIRLDKLLKMNQLKIGEEPKAGEKVYLKFKAPQKSTLRSSKFTPEVTPKIKKEEEPTIPQIRIITPPTTQPSNPPNQPKPNNAIEPVLPTIPSKKEEIIHVDPNIQNHEKEENQKEKIITNTTSPVRTMPSKSPEEPIVTKPIPNNIHVVQKGETLYSISKKYNITVQRLQDLNGLFSNDIEINQYLRYQ